MRRASILLLGGVALALPAVLARANRNGPPAGYTGAPQVQGRDCTCCHKGTVNSGPGRVAISTPATTYVPGAVIPVKVSLAGSLQNVNVNGYQMAAYSPWSSRPLQGWTPSAGDSQVIQAHIEQTRAGVARAWWTCYLTTPPAPIPGFALFAAGNDADGNFFKTGDRIYTTSLAMTAGTVNLTLRAVPVRGTPVRLDLHAPGDAGKPYVMAASLANTGIPAGRGRTIPLWPDDLLLLTLRGLIPWFQGYQGFLDGAGRASATLQIPNQAALKGVTLHHAFVVIDPGQPLWIGTISNPLPVTIF